MMTAKLMEDLLAQRVVGFMAIYQDKKTGARVQVINVMPTSTSVMVFYKDTVTGVEGHAYVRPFLKAFTFQAA